MLHKLPTDGLIQYGTVIATLKNLARPEGAPPWGWQECAAQCADAHDCVYWLLTSVHCVLKASFKGSETTDVAGLLFHGYKECHCRSGPMCTPIAQVCRVNRATGRVFEDPTLLEQVFEPAVIPTASTSIDDSSITFLTYPSQGQCAETCVALNALGKCNAFTYSTATQDCKVLSAWLTSTIQAGAQQGSTVTPPGLLAYVYRQTLLQPCSSLSKVLAPLGKEIAGLPRVLLIGVTLLVFLIIAHSWMLPTPLVGDVCLI